MGRFVALLASFTGALALFVVCFSHVPARADPPGERIVILFDRSGSMKGLLDGVAKIDMGRQLFRQMATDYAGSDDVAVRFFAGGQSQDREENCTASDLALPFGDRSPAVFTALEDRLWAKGKKTPLKYAIQLATRDLDGWPGEKRLIIISDGMDTCGEDPIDLAQALGQSGMKIDVIGLGEPAELRQLAELGLTGNAQFSLAANFGEFAGAMGDTLPELGQLPPIGSGAGASGGSGSMTISTGMGGAPAPPAPIPAAPASPALAPLPPDSPVKVEIRLRPGREQVPDPVAVEIILDVSGSMAAHLNGQAKMAQAMTALSNSLSALDLPHIQLGFRAYGFDHSVEKTPEASCPNTQLLGGFASGQSAKVLEHARSLKPYGYTPIAASIVAAGKDLALFKDMQRQIVLITDGEETCGGDPIQAIRELVGICVSTNTHIIGFDLDPKARAEMQALAAAGCGVYLDAPSGPELQKAMIEINQQVIATPKLDWDRYVNPVTGGKTIETAVSLGAGAFTFENHMDQGDEQFFFVPTGPTQRLRMVVTAQGRLISVDREGKLIEKAGYDFSSFWVDFVDKTEAVLKGPQRRLSFRSAEPGFQKEAQLLDLSGDGIYLRVKANSMKINKDTRFDLFIDEAGDLLPGYDAPGEVGPDLRTIQSFQAVVGHIGLGDRSDGYELSGISDGVEELAIVINMTNPNHKYQIKVEDLDSGRRIAKFNGLTGRQTLFTGVGKGGADLFITIIDQMPGGKSFTSYTLMVEE